MHLPMPLHLPLYLHLHSEIEKIRFIAAFKRQMPHLGHKNHFPMHLPLHLHFAFVFAF